MSGQHRLARRLFDPPLRNQARWRNLDRVNGGGYAVRYALLWLLGVPIPVLILIYFLFN
jgi:hypothetical protein